MDFVDAEGRGVGEGGAGGQFDPQCTECGGPPTPLASLLPVVPFKSVLRCMCTCHVYTCGMAKTVPFTFRIQIEDKKALVEYAALCGYPTPGAFLNDMCHVVFAGDQRKTAQFLQNLILKSGEQLALQLEAQVQELAEKNARATKQAAKLTPAKKGNARRN